MGTRLPLTEQRARTVSPPSLAMSSSQLEPTSTQAPSVASDAAARRLEEQLHDLAGDRATPALAAAQEAARELHAWTLGRPKSWTASCAARELEQGWASWCAQQGWRGATAQLVDDLRSALAGTDKPRPAMLAETRAWMVGAAELGHRARWVEPGRVVPHALRDLRRADVVLVHGYSALCLEALIEAQRAGLAPRVLLSEVAANASGKRMARELVSHGVSVRLTWDLKAAASVEAVDRVWIGCEAVGAGLCTAHLGTTLLLERAREAEVPTRALVTATDLFPGGELELPAWGETEQDSLWCLAPEGVELEAQPFELVDPDLIDTWLTDVGPETLGALCLRALRPEAAAALRP
jgi:hypothetical protein